LVRLSYYNDRQLSNDGNIFVSFSRLFKVYQFQGMVKANCLMIHLSRRLSMRAYPFYSKNWNSSRKRNKNQNMSGTILICSCPDCMALPGVWLSKRYA